MRKMGINKNYVVGIYDDTRHNNLSLDQKRKEITEEQIKNIMQSLKNTF